MPRITIAGLAAALAVASLVAAACRARAPSPAAQSNDTRTAIPLPVSGRDAVLAEMRTMLGSMNGILGAITRSDTAAMRQAAAAAGVVMAADPTLEQLLPPDFLRLGMNTHMQFDSLAAAIGAGAPSDTAIARLARITGNCVSCHAMYRLEPR